MSTQPDESSVARTIKFLIVVVTAILVVVGSGIGLAKGFYAAGRWSGEIQAKLDVILSRVDLVSRANSDNANELADHEKRLSRIELQGSPNLDKIRDRLDSLQKAIDTHMARDLKP